MGVATELMASFRSAGRPLARTGLLWPRTLSAASTLRPTAGAPCLRGCSARTAPLAPTPWASRPPLGLQACLRTQVRGFAAEGKKKEEEEAEWVEPEKWECPKWLSSKTTLARVGVAGIAVVGAAQALIGNIVICRIVQVLGFAPFAGVAIFTLKYEEASALWALPPLIYAAILFGVSMCSRRWHDGDAKTAVFDEVGKANESVLQDMALVLEGSRISEYETNKLRIEAEWPADPEWRIEARAQRKYFWMPWTVISVRLARKPRRSLSAHQPLPQTRRWDAPAVQWGTVWERK
eukprot:NODE_2006_length_1014_cov_322.523462.p2 GENE.NODE_2006_length_1014_cov_322.523462~~NODE_2006_length_1014_cov_322.523462.p2  ORF type:complete len:293 (+),score=67.67 NODE_2006_length_1014_cov_322.523462:3-881(+)